MLSTVTAATQLSVLPLPSVAVRVTLFAPMLAQVNAVGVADNEPMLQLSLLPPSTSAATREPFPPPSNWTVWAWQTAFGETVSATVTVALQVALLPLPSVTVNKAVFPPKSAQA